MNKQTHTALIFFILATGCSGTKPELGVNNGQLTPCPKSPNCVHSQAADTKHHIQPLQYTETQQEARDRLLQIINSEKRAKIMIAQQDYIRVQFTSALFRFVDDVEFYFPPEQDGEKVIHIRSASRIGNFDFGANRKRIEKIRNRFNQ